MKRIAIGFSALVVTASLAACGGGGGDALSKEAYEDKVAGVGSTLAAAFEELAVEADALAGDEVASGDDLRELTEQLSTLVGDAADSVGAAAEDLDGVTPPEDAQAANDQLVEGLQALLEDVDAVQGALDEGDFASVLDLAPRLQEIAGSEAGLAISNAIEELRAKGYEVDPE